MDDDLKLLYPLNQICQKIWASDLIFPSSKVFRSSMGNNLRNLCNNRDSTGGGS